MLQWQGPACNRPIEGAALFFTGTLVLAGFAAYVVSEQNDPSRKMAIAVFFVFAASMIGAYVSTAVVVSTARRKRRSKVSMTHQHKDHRGA